MYIVNNIEVGTIFSFTKCFVYININTHICFNYIFVDRTVIVYKIDKEDVEDTKGITRICKSKKDREHNGQKKTCKRTNNDVQHIAQKINIVQRELHLKPGLRKVIPSKQFLFHMWHSSCSKYNVLLYDVVSRQVICRKTDSYLLGTMVSR